MLALVAGSRSELVTVAAIVLALVLLASLLPLIVALRRAESRQRRRLELLQLDARILESFLASDDIDATVAATLAETGTALGFARGIVCVEEDAGGGLGSGAASRPLAAWSAVPSRAEDAVAPDVLAWRRRELADGRPRTIERGDRAMPVGVAPTTRRVLAAPIVASGRSIGAILFEDERPARSADDGERAVLSTFAFAVARALEQREAAEERSRFLRLQRALERSELVAQFVSAASHDFNNILFAVSGRLQLLRQRSRDIEEIEAFAEIERVLDSAGELVADLLKAHRGDLDPPGPLALRRELDEALGLARRLLPRSMRLEVSGGFDGEAFVRSTAQAIRQLVVNLVLNARDATGGRGRVRISSDRRDDVVLLRFEDDGPGIPAELAEAVFRPYFTTKGSAGTGLGLAICRRIAHEAGGEILLDRSPELGGLRVEVRLPAAERPDLLATPSQGERSGDERAAAPTDDPLRDLGMALVVEDEPAIRALLRDCFAAHDIETIERADASDLESIVLDAPVRIDLLVLDVDLPGRRGPDALAALRARGDRTPCIVITGGSEFDLDRALAPARLLRKPFRLEALIEACRALVRPTGGR
jgi:signal transduction histidine kinase/CheY-like chemotaxis protein